MAVSAPLSLYLELDEGRLATLESAARIELAWNDLILATFAITDPSADVTVEILDAVESSLGVRSFLRAVGKISKQHPLLAGALSASLATFFQTPVQAISNDVWRGIYEAVGYTPDDAAKCAAEDPEGVKAAAEKAQSPQFAGPQKRELFTQLERASVVSSAGAVPSVRVKPPPPLIVPRADFAQRGGILVISEETAQKKKTSERLRAILLTPKLKAKELMWEFADESGRPFSAKMRDPDYIRALEEGRTGADLRIGLQMEIEVLSKLETVNGIWMVRSQEVTKVYSPVLPSAPDFFGYQ